MQRLRRLTAYPTDPPSPLNCSQLDTSLDFDVNWLYKAAISPEGEPFSSCRLPLLAKCNAFLFFFFPDRKSRLLSRTVVYTLFTVKTDLRQANEASLASLCVALLQRRIWSACVRACVRRRRRKRARRKSPIICKFVANK